MKQQLDDLVGNGANRTTTTMVYTLPGKKSGAIELDVDSGIVLIDELDSGIVQPVHRLPKLKSQ